MRDVPSSETGNVLRDVVAERHRQIELWGHNTDTPDGTGPDVRWLPQIDVMSDTDAAMLEEQLRLDYEDHARSGEPLTWMHFLREEFAEAMQESDPDRLYTELIEVAAVAVSWCEKLRTR